VSERRAEIPVCERYAPVEELSGKRLVQLIEPPGRLDLRRRELALAAHLAQRISRRKSHEKEQQDGNDHQRDEGLEAPPDEPAFHLKVHSLISSQEDSGRMGALVKRRFTA
jgi:hypothetical protein